MYDRETMFSHAAQAAAETFAASLERNWPRLGGRLERRSKRPRKDDGCRCEGRAPGVGGAAVLLRRLLRFHFERTPALLFRFWRLFRRPPRKTWPHAAIKRFRLSGSKAQEQARSCFQKKRDSLTRRSSTTTNTVKASSGKESTRR